MVYSVIFSFGQLFYYSYFTEEYIENQLIQF